MKNHIFTISNLTLKHPVFALIISFLSLLSACKSKNEIVTPPNQPPGNFTVTSTLGANGRDVILKWTKSKDPDGDAITYSVVYTDTLAKNLSDTTYTIKNLPFETEIKGSVVAKDTKGGKTIRNFSIKTGADYVTIYDVNFERALIRLKIDDAQDAKVLKTSILKVTYLDISWRGDGNEITNLTGIEEFANLTHLNCHNNKLTNLDVSKNIALTVLDCSNNELTNLDVSKNIALTVLFCHYNKLTNLDVNKNIALTKLAFISNQLTNLDVSKNIALTDLYCYFNKLTNLDVSKNIALINLDCYGNQLTNLDVSNNIALTKLDCQNNLLTNLYISKSIALTGLYCNNNLLTNLDVSKNTILNRLDCYSNKIQTICVNSLNQIQLWYKDPFTTYKVCP